MATALGNTDPAPEDKYRWLEEVHGDAALAWVREHNAKTQERLQAWPDFEATRKQLLAILDSKDRIANVGVNRATATAATAKPIRGVRSHI